MRELPGCCRRSGWIWFPDVHQAFHQQNSSFPSLPRYRYRYLTPSQNDARVSILYPRMGLGTSPSNHLIPLPEGNKLDDEIFALLRTIVYNIWINKLPQMSPLPHSFFSNYSDSLASPLVLFKLCPCICISMGYCCFFYTGISSISPILFTPPLAFLYRKGKQGESSTALS